MNKNLKTLIFFLLSVIFICSLVVSMYFLYKFISHKDNDIVENKTSNELQQFNDKISNAENKDDVNYYQIYDTILNQNISEDENFQLLNNFFTTENSTINEYLLFLRLIDLHNDETMTQALGIKMFNMFSKYDKKGYSMAIVLKSFPKEKANEFEFKIVTIMSQSMHKENFNLEKFKKTFPFFNDNIGIQAFEESNL